MKDSLDILSVYNESEKLDETPVEVLEKKANKLIKEINSNLNALDRKYYEKTKMINQTADHDYKPSKSIVDGLAYQLNSSIGIKLDKESGRVRKGWKYGQATP